jgi:hypothetical protein
MKQPLKLLVLISLFTSLLIAQNTHLPKIDSTIIYLNDKYKAIIVSDSGVFISELLVQRYETNQYVNYYRSLYSYNINGNLSEYLSQSWNNSSWENSYRMQNTYNAQGLLATSIFQYFDMGWQNSSKTEQSYNSYGNLQQTIDSYWMNSAWEPNYKSDFTYDGQQRLSEQVSSSYYYWQSPPVWVYNHKINYKYNALSQVDSDLVSNHNGTDWEPYSRTSYTYTPSGNQETSYTETNDSGWIPWTSDSSAFDSNDNQTYNIYKQHDGTTWQDIEMRENTFYNNLLMESVYTSWMYNPYEIWKSRDLFNYNNNNLVTQTYQSWENNQWMNEEQMNMTYDANNNVAFMEIFDWNGASWDPFYKYIYSTLLDADDEDLAKEFLLLQNYPNPFNSTTRIIYTIPNTTEVRLILYNALGEIVKVLEQGVKLPGKHEVLLDDNSLSSGVYFYELRTPNRTVSKKMILLK